ncbi:SulP family inorganic anion transporter [Pleurocapsales cyanobacterium LEGE 06147]|nr:SulP family inorganic anion transporter [Pleurocapsales cyanobacterium LEGE 06147]
MSIKLVNTIHFRNLRGDLFGGLTASIVALPLALAFGVASGAGAIAGLYGAIFVGFFAALFGGTPAQVSGPTGPMTVVITTVIATLVARYPDTGLAMAFTVVMLGGLFQILFGVLHLGQYITLMPYTVISGFMSGIGIIIIVLQLPPLLGYAGTGTVWETLQQLPSYFSQPDPVATSLGVLTLVLVFTAPPKLNRILPSPLLALIVGTVLSVVMFGNADIPRIGEIPNSLPTLRMPTFSLGEGQDILRYGLMLGVLGAIDSLLTSLVADSISRTQHDSDKELIGQGIGNCLAGLFGGLPGAGATMRTVVNVQAGGKTPLSGMIHALVLLLVVLWAEPLTRVIPHAVLAGLLLKVGIDIIDWSFIKRIPRLSLKGTGLMYLVLFLTVFVDLITAVVVGVFIANLLTIKRLTDVQSDRVKAITDPTQPCNLSPAEQQLLSQAQGDILLFQLGGPLSFGAAKTISRRMTIVQDYRALVLDLSEVPTIGVTAALAIETMVQDAVNRHRQVWIVVPPGQVQRRIEKLQLQRFVEIHQMQNRFLALQAALVFMQAKTSSPVTTIDP